MIIQRWDVIVVGAGPAGSSAAALLADAGHRVLVLERTHFPRFHIGESLLPVGLTVLDRLGLEPDEDAFCYKRGARFISEERNLSLEVSFDEAYPGAPRHAWQVDRAGFDTRLRDRAIAGGAEVRHGEKVTDISVEKDGVRVTTATERYHGRYVLDATGQDRFLARRNRTVVPYKDFGMAAAFVHFDGIDPALGSEDGDIRIMVLPEGWGWIIPLPNNRLSVGVITQKKGASAAMAERYVEHSPLVRAWTKGAVRSPAHLVSNFSFKNDRPTGARFACIGDAACFLDPVFSSGVSLALKSSEKAVALLSPALAEGKEADPDLMAPLSDHMSQAYTTFARLIHRFYNTKLIDNLFFSAPPDTPLRQGIISVLAGDVWRTDNPFQKMLLTAKRRRTANRYQVAV